MGNVLATEAKWFTAEQVRKERELLLFKKLKKKLLLMNPFPVQMNKYAV